MLEIPVLVANAQTDSELVDIRSVIGTQAGLEEYAICGVRCPAGLEATAASLLMGWASDVPLPFHDDAGDEITFAVGVSRVTRLKASDYPVLPPYIGISLGTQVNNAEGRTLAILLRKI